MTTATLSCFAGESRESSLASARQSGASWEGISNDPHQDGNAERRFPSGTPLYLFPCAACSAHFSPEGKRTRAERRLRLRRTGEGAQESCGSAQSDGTRSGGRGGGRKTIRTALCRVSWRNGGGWAQGSQFARPRSAAGYAGDAVLDTHQRSGPPRHARVVEAARAAALADRDLCQDARSYRKISAVSAAAFSCFQLATSELELHIELHAAWRLRGDWPPEQWRRDRPNVGEVVGMVEDVE